MKKITKVSLIGLGGVGAAYASKLHNMNPACLTVIAENERYERYIKEGFIINGEGYRFNYTKPQDKAEPADLIIISTKYHQLAQAVKDIKHHIGTDTIILSLLNGISSEQIIGQEYGMEKVLYGMVLSIDAVRQNNKIEFADTAAIYFGEKNNNIYSDKVKAVKELFDQANIKYIIPEDMLRTLWWKFLFNVGINQMSAVLKYPYKVFCTIPEAEQLMRSAMQEVVNIAKKAQVDLDERDIDYFVKLLSTMTPEGKTSMLQDIEAGRKTEVEMLAGEVCKLGEQYKVQTPINQMLFLMLRSMEKAFELYNLV